MEAIKRIVSEISFMCRLKNVTVSDTLAAFVTHAIVLEHVNLFPLDKELNESDVQDLVRMAVERLLTVDSASLETIKMQVAFDTAKLDEVDILDAARAAREEREAALLHDIVDMRLKGANDVEALTALYRRIFNFLVLRAGLEAGANRPAEREIAAALESVFPRIGLKAFTLLSPDDKSAQLHELANIVLGIRLFNRSIGKGGIGIVDFPALARARIKEFLQLTGTELENISTLCDQYSEVLSNRHSVPRAALVAAMAPDEQAADAAKTARLQEELANRRQLAAYIALLFDGLQQSAKHVAELERLHDKELDNLKQIVGAKSSVPKEHVYPRFDALAKLWVAFEEEAAMLQVRRQTLDVLYQYRGSFVPRLKSEDVSAARAARRAAAAIAAGNGGVGESRAAPLGGARSARDAADGSRGGGSDAGGVMGGGVGGAGARPGGADGARGEGLFADEDAAERIAPDYAPSMLQLSLELEGYCPVTLVDKAGLLLPGSAECIVRYRRRYYACVDDGAAGAFVASPARYVQGTLAQATRSPELIQLLRLQEHFPGTSIAEVMRQARARAPISAEDALLGAPARAMMDAQMQTQVHLVDKHIDHSYEFSEWALRRRALQLANLRCKATKASQTAKSHMRTEATTQVYLPRESGTQTAVTTGTEAPRMVNYITGLRGHPDSEMHVVNLTIDPGAPRVVKTRKGR